MSEIKSVKELDEALARGPYAWPGGYPLYYITSDGGALAPQTVKDERDSIVDSIETETDDGWRVVAIEVNYEDEDLFDDHTGDQIESAYGDDDDD